MIENYLKTGVRLKWSPPSAVQMVLDGAIVDNRGVTSNMIYNGLDGELFDPAFGVTNVSTLGFQMRMPIQHVWLDYVHGRTSRAKSLGSDILTGFMSGCLIARWKDNGMTYVGHIGTIYGNKTAADLVKNNFAAVMSADTTGFNPFAAWSTSEMLERTNKFKITPTSNIMALVTDTGEFYAILMLLISHRTPDDWCVGGIKKVTPLDKNALFAELIKK